MLHTIKTYIIPWNQNWKKKKTKTKIEPDFYRI